MNKDIILEAIRDYENHGIIRQKTLIDEAVFHHDLFNEVMEEDANVDSEERNNVLQKINNDDYIVDNYVSFSNELRNNKRSSFLTKYTPNELKDSGTHTYQVEGYQIGFALKPQADGNIDIISVHNNTDIKGIGEALIDSAIRLGGTQLDHFDGFLSDFYQKKGFNEVERYKWDDQYAPDDWNYDTYGRPDVIVRQINKKSY